MDKTIKPSTRIKRGKLEAGTVRQWLGTIQDAIPLSGEGNITRVDQGRLQSLEEPFQSHFVSYFKLRTKIDLYRQ